MPPLVMALVFNKMQQGADAFLRQADRQGHRRQGARRLRASPTSSASWPSWKANSRPRPWFAGRAFTAADVMMSFPIEAASSRGALEADFPNLNGFLERIHERPAYKRALDRGGPYALLG